MLTETSKINVTDHTEPFNNSNDDVQLNNENSALNDHHDRADESDHNNSVRIEELDKTVNDEKEDVITRNMTELTCDEEEEDDHQTYEIIDGIMIMNFENENDLNEFTINDEKTRKKNEDKKQQFTRLKKTNVNRNSTSSATVNRKKSTSTTKQLDSAFVSSELDDYLSSRKGNKYSNIDLENSFNSIKTAGKSTANKRKSTIDVQYNEDLNETNIHSAYSNINGFLDSDSSLDQSLNISFNGSSTSKNTKNRKPFNNSLSRTYLNKSTSKSKNKKPEMIVFNQIDQELKDTDEFDSAYLKCLALVKRTYDLNREQMKTKFRAAKLTEYLCRSALSTLYPNSQTNITTSDNDPNSEIVNNVNKNSKKINTDKKVSKQTVNEPNVAKDQNSLRSNLENSSVNNCDKSNITSPLIKSELDNKLSRPFDFIEKKVTKKKIRNEANEEGYDITRIISKHSKRDIRLPARYHESGILVGSQWILPNFEENKNRIVNTGTGKKQSSTGKSAKKSPTKLTDKNESSKLASNNFSTTSNSSVNFALKTNGNNQAFDQSNLNPEDLMTEDEDNTTSPTPNNPNNINNLIVNDKSEISVKKLPNKKNQLKEKKIVMLRDMYRQLFYANRPQRKDYFTSISIKPRVNKSEVLQEGIDTIAAMATQKKCLNHANNLLITWNNKLKICLSTIEQHSKGLSLIDLKEFESMEKMVNTYRNNILKKVNQEITTVKMFDEKINIFDLSTIASSNPITINDDDNEDGQQSSNGKSKLSTSLNNGLNCSNSASTSKQANTSTFNNCQSNVAFLDNTNGISRVMNLKPKKSLILPNKSTNLSNLKAKGISSQQFMNNVKIKNKTYSRVKKIEVNNGTQPKNNQLNNKGFIHFNNFTQSPPTSSTSNSYLTLKITGNGLQIPFCPEVLPQIASPPSQINHLIHPNPQLIPNSSLANTAPYMNYCFKQDDKLVPFNFLKPNETIATTSHPNLSISETLPSTQASNSINSLTPINPSSQQNSLIRNYPKIAPKCAPTLGSSNMLKLTTPLSFIPNLQFVPTTHNLVISPPMNNISSTITTACQPTQNSTTQPDHHSFQQQKPETLMNNHGSFRINGEKVVNKNSNQSNVPPKYDTNKSNNIRKEAIG